MLSPNFSTILNQSQLQVPPINVKQEVTQEKFAGFLEWLNPDRDLAGEEYERLRFRLCTFFPQRRCSYADELADETVNRDPPAVIPTLFGLPQSFASQAPKAGRGQIMST